jgi:insulin receptor
LRFVLGITSKQFANISGSYLLTGLDQGNYSIQIMASSLAGDGNYTPPRYIFIQEEGSVLTPVLIAIGIVVIIIFASVSYWYRRKDQSMRANMKLIASVNPEYVSMTYQPDEWEVPRENIIQLQELGQGSFGMVVIKQKTID